MTFPVSEAMSRRMLKSMMLKKMVATKACHSLKVGRCSYLSLASASFVSYICRRIQNSTYQRNEQASTYDTQRFKTISSAEGHLRGYKNPDGTCGASSGQVATGGDRRLRAAQPSHCQNIDTPTPFNGQKGQGNHAPKK